MTDDITTSVRSGALVATELQQLIESSRKQFDLPPYVDPKEYEAWKQEKNDIQTQQRTLRDQYLNLDRTYTGRDRYLERLSTYSAPFISNTTPVRADQCAMHGWIDTKERHTIANTEIYRLTCQQCSAFLDVPNLTSANPDFVSVKRIYSLYPKFLNENHSDVCFWHTTSCHISVCAFPLVTTSDAFNLLETHGKLFQQWGNELPVINTSFDQSKMRILHRIVKAIEGIDVFSFPQQQLTAIHETAYLLPMFGWHCLEEHDYRLLKCTCCFRHVLVSNYLRMNDDATLDINKSMAAQSSPTSRPERINGVFDPLNEHRPYCPWRNRDTARMNIKDSFFVPPKQPLNGCDWMLEIMCKEWFRMTTEDEKHPRHGEFRQNAERYLSTSIASNSWMTSDLTKYALSKSLKRTISDSSSDQSSPNKKDKRQHTPDANDEQIQKLETEITNDTSAPDSTLSTTKDKDIKEGSHANAHSPTQTMTSPVNSSLQDSSPSSLPQYETPEVAGSEMSIEKSLESATTELQPQNLDIAAFTTLESSSELEFGSTLENKATGEETGMDQVAVIEHDVGIRTEDDKTGTTANEGIPSGVVDNQDTNESQETIPSEQHYSELTSADDDQTTIAGHDIKTTQIEPSPADAASNMNDDEQGNIPTTDNGDIIETNQVEATLDTELSGGESKDVLQHDVKEDYLLTPNGEAVSTPTSWGLADTDNTMSALGEDENKADRATMEIENDSGNMDNYASITADSDKQQPDTQQDENDDLLSSAYSGGNEGNMDVANNDLDLYDHQPESTPTIETEIDHTKKQKHNIQNDSATTPTTTGEEPSIDIVEHDLAMEEKAPADMVETTAETVDHMDFDQEENEQQTKTTMELELDELDTVNSPNAENPDIASNNDDQLSQLPKATESDVQLDHIATPQDILDANITTPKDIKDDNMPASPDAPIIHKDDEAISQDIEGENAIPDDMGKDEHTALTNMDTDGTALQDSESTGMSPHAADELNVATPLNMVDHNTTNESEYDDKDSTQDKPGDEPTTHTMDDNEVTGQDVHTADTINLVASYDNMESTTNESGTQINEQEMGQGNIADTGDHEETQTYLEHGELDDAITDVETGVEIVEIPVNQESDVVTSENVNDKTDQQYESKESQTVSSDLHNDTQTTDNIDYEEIKSSDADEQLIDESYQTIDEQVEEDIGEVEDAQNPSSPLVAVEVVAVDDEIINKDTTELDEPKTAIDEVSDEKVHDNNNETDLDENSGAEDQSNKDNNNDFLDEHDSNDIQDEDTDNHSSLDQHDETDKEENNENNSLLDQTNEALLVEADNNESSLDQQDNTDYDDLMEQNTTEIDEQDFNSNNQSAPVPSSPRNGSNNDGEKSEVEGNDIAVAQDLGTEGQTMVDADHNASLNDPFIISPSSTTPQPGIDQDRKDDDHLMAYEEDETVTEVMDATALTDDNNKDDEAMLEQDDLMEE
ncbi:hypothetical protein BCR42DRAFT_426041 [Absidia repens]|uniref:C3HC zinc finger-like-domain-containing protein n=1 Tax=Absidia repens TaxID=90262 RepID=A0A1X2I248_9FUNG|nr:hypothetical protein BCR42DRAFT_426041 [Absidia repens]